MADAAMNPWDYYASQKSTTEPVNFDALEKENGLPSGLLNAVMKQESGGNVNAISPKGAVGPFQLMPGTAQQLGVKDPTDLGQAAAGAAKYLGQLKDKFNGDINSALAAYNWGPGNVEKYGLDRLPPETSHYVKTIGGQFADQMQPSKEQRSSSSSETQNPWDYYASLKPANNNQSSPANSGEDLGAKPAFYGGIVQGAIPFGNKITAGIGALTAGGFQGANQLAGNDVPNPQTIGQYYDQIRENQAATEAAHPAANLAGVGTGAVATLPIFGGIGDALAAGKVTAPLVNALRPTQVAQDAGALSKAGNLAANVIKSGITAAPVGALYGAGSAPEGQELQGAEQGAALGGALGAAIPAAGSALSTLNKALGRDIIPGAQELRGLASKAYQEASNNGGLLTPEFSDKFVDTISKLKPQTPLGQAVTGETPFTQMVDKLQVLKGKPISLDTAQEIDEALGDAIDGQVDNGSLNKQGKKLLDLQTAFRNSIGDAAPEDITGGKDGFDALEQGRKLWAASRRMDDVERIITRAQYSVNPDTAIKTGFKTILSNPSRLRGFSQDEIKAMQEAASGGPISEALKTLGSGLVRVFAPFSGAGLAGDAAIAAGSMASKDLSTKLALNKAANVAKAVANRVQPTERQPLLTWQNTLKLPPAKAQQILSQIAAQKAGASK